jgi:hypothetical protein
MLMGNFFSQYERPELKLHKLLHFGKTHVVATSEKMPFTALPHKKVTPKTFESEPELL